MSKAKTFVLAKKKTYRRGVRIFIKDREGKFSTQTLVFTKEHLMDSKMRNQPRIRTVVAEYITDTEEFIEALYSDSAYGKDFYEKGDPEGKKKRPTRIVSEEDAGMVALANLFKAAGLTFDPNKPINVLKKEYEFHVSAQTGSVIGKSTASEIPHEPVNVAANIAADKDKARRAYEEKYGEPVPGEVYNDVTFLDGLSNPNFDAKAYIEAKTAPGIEVGSEEHQQLLDDYRDKLGKNVPSQYKNNIDWILERLG